MEVGQDIGFDFSQFDVLINNFDIIKEEVKEIIEYAFEEAGGPGVAEFKKHIPRSELDNPQGHAIDNIYLAGTYIGRSGIAYKKITFKGDRSYLYILDAGTSTTFPKPWRKKAYKAVRQVTDPIIANAIATQINERLGR